MKNFWKTLLVAVDEWLWFNCSLYRNWSYYRALARVKAMRKAILAQFPPEPIVPRPDLDMSRNQGSHEDFMRRLATIEAPQWLKDRMEAIRKLPPPTLRQVRRQLIGCKRQKIQSKVEYAEKGQCYDCGQVFQRCTCETRLDSVGICPHCYEAHLECKCPNETH